MAKANGHGAEELSRRERRLRRLAHWPEMELRLRYGWSPERVLKWHQERWPGERVPGERTLWRFLKDQPGNWFVKPWDVLETGSPAGQNGTWQRILVHEELTGLIQFQKARVLQFRQLELATGQGGFGLPIPQVGLEVERLTRALLELLRVQQELGLEPKLTLTGRDEDEPEGSAREELRRLVGRVLDLPPEEFVPSIVALLGPPPVKQPLVLEGEVLASEKVEPPAGAEEPLQGDDGQAEESDAD